MPQILVNICQYQPSLNITLYFAGFFKAEHYLVSNTVQFNLTTMARVAIDDCILISNMTRDSIPFAMR